jgi:hypothetical protein
VSSLALQLAESITHLCEFWQSITDAPESVRDIAKELHVISTILASIANTALPERQIDMKLVLETCMYFPLKLLFGNTWSKCCCSYAGASQIEPLHSITRQLMQQFCSTSKAKRKWAAIESVFKAEKIDQCRDAIERTKTTLVLANQQHLMMMVAAGFQEQRLWRNAMAHLVTDDRSHRNIVGEVFSDVNLPPDCGPLEEIMRNGAMRPKTCAPEYSTISPPIPELKFAGAEPKLRSRTQVSAVSLATLPSGHKNFPQN